MASGVMTEDGVGTWGGVDAQGLGTDRHTAIGADFDFGAQAPDKGPPGAVERRAQHGALFVEGQIPGLLGLHFEFTVHFVLVAVETQFLDMGIGLVEVGDVFAGEVSGQTLLPEEMRALDFTFGLGCGSVAEAHAIEVQSPAQLGESFWGVGEKEAVVIDVDFQRQPVIVESGGQQIKVGQQAFGLVDSGGGENSTAIIKHVDHGEGLRAVGKPAMGCGVQLPEFANAAALPAPDRSCGAVIGFGVGQVVFHGPTPNLSSIGFELAFPEQFAGCKAVGSRRFAAEPFAQEGFHFGGPPGRMVAPRNTWGPVGLLMLNAGMKVITIDLVEACASQAESLGTRLGFNLSGPEEGQHMTDKRSSTAVGQL